MAGTKELKIKSESLPTRCEVCHQSDCFDPVTNFCLRCAGLTAERLLPQATSDVNREKAYGTHLQNNFHLVLTRGIIVFLFIIAGIVAGQGIDRLIVLALCAAVAYLGVEAKVKAKLNGFPAETALYLRGLMFGVGLGAFYGTLAGGVGLGMYAATLLVKHKIFVTVTGMVFVDDVLFLCAVGGLIDGVYCAIVGGFFGLFTASQERL